MRLREFSPGHGPLGDTKMGVSDAWRMPSESYTNFCPFGVPGSEPLPGEIASKRGWNGMGWQNINGSGALMRVTRYEGEKTRHEKLIFNWRKLILDNVNSLCLFSKSPFKLLYGGVNFFHNIP